MQALSLMSRWHRWSSSGRSDEKFWELAEAHSHFLFNVALKYTGNRFDAEDLVQEALASAFKKFYQLRDSDKFKSWMFMILRNQFLKTQRKKAPVEIDSIEDKQAYTDILAGLWASGDIESAYERKVETETVHRLLEQLPEKYRTVLVLFYLEERSYKEVAETLSIPMGTVMSRLSRAKSAMKKAILRSLQGRPDREDILPMHTAR